MFLPSTCRAWRRPRWPPSASALHPLPRLPPFVSRCESLNPLFLGHPARLDMKAYKTKIVLRFICEEVGIWAIGGEGSTRVLNSCVFGLCDLVHRLDTGGIVLSADDAAAAQRSGKLFLRSYSFLASEALAEGRALFKLRPKIHYLSHVIYDCLPTLNPRFAQNFLDEDFVGKVVKAAALCHPRTVPLRCLQRIKFAYIRHWRRARG